jgi:type I restriction-modification system DNA methylase subunit
MINRQSLLSDLQKFLQRIEADLLERSESTEVPEVPSALHSEYEKAAKAERTAQNYEDWRTDTITQAAAAWVLSCVFVRFLEDNSLIDPPKIAGPGDRLARARDEHELYFRSHPQHTDREYLLSIFAELAKLPGTKDVFGEHNAINDLPNWLSGDAAGELLNFFQKIDASTGELVHDFTDPNWDTRFLGDLYQDLSEAARKKFALLQTPDFVEEFILDRTLEPALDHFGLVPQQCLNDSQATSRFRMIDPACGSGHFLLGAFPRLLKRWQSKEPSTNIRELTQRTLHSIHGVDINPFAVAIAKFRLLLTAMQSCDIRRLADAPAFQVNVACGDSLLHGENRTSTGQNLMDFADGATDHELYAHAYPGEDLQTIRILLRQGTYHCVVANPPYIVPSDANLNKWYRNRFSACHRAYSLAVPFMQQIFQLAMYDGFTGQITATGFMRREFGKKLVEVFFPKIELTHVIDTSGVVFGTSGFGGTSTIILFGRNRSPVSAKVRTVMGLKGEPTIPLNPAEGCVWTSIVDSVDHLNLDNEYLSVRDLDRSEFHSHPWSIRGGGASELKTLLDQSFNSTLDSLLSDNGARLLTRLDEVFQQPSASLHRAGLSSYGIRNFIVGQGVRDFRLNCSDSIIYPYDGEAVAFPDAAVLKYLWRWRPDLSSRVAFGKTQLEHGKAWYEYSMFFRNRLRVHSLVFSDLATHNHFVLDESNTLTNSHAQALVPKAPDSDSIYLLGILNSSTGCFWMKQVFHCHGAGGGTRVKAGKSPMGDESWENHYEFDGTKLKKMPIPAISPAVVEIATEIQKHARQLVPLDISVSMLEQRDKRSIQSLQEDFSCSIQRLISLQEELDWRCYEVFALTDEVLTAVDPPRLSLGQRAFEIVLARKIVSGEIKSSWFDRHSSSLVTEMPSEWPENYKKVVERRIELIENDPNIRLIEQPEYKRRWNTEPWESQLERALREWLLLRLETYFDFDGRMTDKADASNRRLPLAEIAMCSVAQLADAARRDPQFMEVGELYRDDPAFDVQALVEELVQAESVPHLPVLRYKDSGLRKRAEWEKTWDLQRREDAGEAVGTIPVPPKYTSADFISTGGARYWSLRGKLDVPKERWISFPHCEGPDGTLVICWAGYDHLQQAQAISAYYVRVQTEFGGSDDPRLIPLLASLIELLPWLKQWHNEPNANFDGLRMGDYFESFVNEEARNLGKTLAEIKAWVPPKKVAKTTAPKRSSKKVKSVEVDE